MLQGLVRKTGSSKSGREYDESTKKLRQELEVLEKEKHQLIKELTSKLGSDSETFSPDFTLQKCQKRIQPESYLLYVENIEDKISFLSKSVLRLEEVQIAESIMRVFRTKDSSLFRIKFDEAVLNLEMEIPVSELLRLNKLREFSLFGIHRTGPNSPFLHYSYFDELHEYTKLPGFSFNLGMSFNQDPNAISKESLIFPVLEDKSAHQKQIPMELFMCHHCKVLLPESCFFECSKKCKRLLTEPCKCHW